MMTPFELEILLHYYYSPAEHGAVIMNVPIWEETREKLLRNDLLKISPSEHGSYATTERAHVLIDHILSLPLPEHKWVMPEGE